MKLFRAKKLSGSIQLPGDKSISHRALIMAAGAIDTSSIENLGSGADVLSTLNCLKDLGVKFVQTSKSGYLVEGKGLIEFKAPESPLDCGNSGTTMRLFMGLLSGSQISAQLTGDSSLNARPMKRIEGPLSKLGANIELSSKLTAPLIIKGRPLKGSSVELEVPSAQLKSSLMLAAIQANGKTTLKGKIESRDHTERMFKSLGINYKKINGTIELIGPQTWKGFFLNIPGDLSTAAFFMAAAVLVPNSKLIIKNVSLNPTRLGFYRALKSMGADLRINLESENNFEPRGSITIQSSNLRQLNISGQQSVDLIDEIPILAVVASQASGVSTLKDLSELRIKECDRIEAIKRNFENLGLKIEVIGDDLIIPGNQKIRGGSTIEAFGDHRIAMAFSIASLIAETPTTIDDMGCVDVSYPSFFDELNKLCSQNQEVVQDAF